MSKQAMCAMDCTRTWCGRYPHNGERTFDNVQHALYVAQAEGELILCDECADSMVCYLSGKYVGKNEGYRS